LGYQVQNEAETLSFLLQYPDTKVLYDSAAELEMKLRQLLQLVDVTHRLPGFRKRAAAGESPRQGTP